MLEVGIEQHGSDAARRAAERAQRLSGDIVGTSMLRVRGWPRQGSDCALSAFPSYRPGGATVLSPYSREVTVRCLDVRQ